MWMSLAFFAAALRETKRALALDPMYTPQKLELAIELPHEEIRLTVAPPITEKDEKLEHVEDFHFDPAIIEELFAEKPVRRLTPIANDAMAGFALARDLITKGLYDRVIEYEALAFLEAEARIGAVYHLVLAADVLMYFDDLTAVLEASAQVLAPKGALAFSVETHEGDAVLLRETLRYAHGEAHVRAALAAAALKTVSLDCASTRTEKGKAVPGLIVVATH